MSQVPKSRATVLIIDDEPVLRNILSNTINRAGFKAVTAMDGMDGLEKLRGARIDIVISDIKMPRMDGLEFLSRSKVEFPEIPVILITAYANEFTGRDAFASGADDFIVKPFKNHDIKYALERMLVRVNQKRAKEEG